ncbi:MAG: hypothetical protein Greene041614_344 [Parcubacteria group bacterium Greene0416_14]|nr:MAG: hypothetical protein Greene041614_344 [Parcubacteria group bacterium Greene0416_14]TSD01312.1 MAG: hypothetical protein Greene101415_326 [Parcubacteria group bacterium Greene1014_15]TSD07999.1 MAG: hypothetical protein Greene07144_487 [Parcubacteria group bacterium Greene0714_4]
MGRQRIEDPKRMIEWVQNVTGITKPIQEPCPASYQLRTLFLKFITPKGEGKRDKHTRHALETGKQYPGAPRPEECVAACLRFEYLEDLNSIPEGKPLV